MAKAKKVAKKATKKVAKKVATKSVKKASKKAILSVDEQMNLIDKDITRYTTEIKLLLSVVVPQLKNKKVAKKMCEEVIKDFQHLHGWLSQ